MGEFLLEILAYVLIYALAYPVVGLLATPFILFLALWGEGPYLANVWNYYRRVFRRLGKVLEKAQR